MSEGEGWHALVLWCAAGAGAVQYPGMGACPTESQQCCGASCWQVQCSKWRQLPASLVLLNCASGMLAHLHAVLSECSLSAGIPALSRS